MRRWDRLFRALFVAAAVGLGWGIRGDFGHMLGAMYPGAVLGMAFAYVTGQKSMFKWMPLLAAVSGLGISLGGKMSYGILHGYAKADTFINYAYGFFTLFLQGGAWGGFGCAALGLVLERKRLRLSEWASLVATILVAGWATYHVIVTLGGFHINPPRSDLSIGYTGGIIGLFIWLVLHAKRYGFRGALFGYLGFGFGMTFGRLLANALTRMPAPFAINNWNVMEVSAGFFGGLLFTYGMLGRKFDDPPEGDWHPLLSHLSIVYVIAGIPLFHRLLRIDPGKKLAEYARAAQSWGFADPNAFADRVMSWIHVWCLLGFVGAGVWLYLHIRNRYRFAWLPTLWFSLVMLLIQNTNARYFWYPAPGAGHVNMHSVFWVLYAFMVVFVVAFEVLHRHRAVSDPDEVVERVRWRRWVAAGVACYLCIILAAGFVNGKKTMGSANTRWPLWSWRDGPYPGK